MPAILIEKNIMLPMRDGARLATDVFGWIAHHPRRSW
jgi:predicted acyl esterase